MMETTPTIRPASVGLSLFLLGGLFLFGCSSETAKQSNDIGTPDTSETDSGSPDSGEADVISNTLYPSGPFGVEEGDIITDLEFVNPDGSAFMLSELYQDKSNKLLLVSTSAGWCTACIEEQPTLQAKYDQYKDKGLVVMVSLFETIDYEPATAQLAEAWKMQYELDFLVVSDPDFVFSAYYNTDLTPMNMFVDLTTMTILYIGTGWDESVADAILESQL